MDSRLQAFLNLIAWSEGTSTASLTQNNGYDVIVTGVDGASVFTDYSNHPFAHGGAVIVRLVPRLVSSAAGRYQLLARYWNIYRVELQLKDFSPASQDAVALQQIHERGGLGMLLSDNPQGAIEACSNIWASFPGNAYGQGNHSMDTLLAKYAGGKI